MQHRAYQEILRRGEVVLPLIIEEVRAGRGHWFAALRQLTEANPVPREDVGYADRMRQQWLDWWENRHQPRWVTRPAA